MCDPSTVEGNSEVYIELSSSASRAGRPSTFPDALGLVVADRISGSIKRTAWVLGGGLLRVAHGVSLTKAHDYPTGPLANFDHHLDSFHFSL